MRNQLRQYFGKKLSERKNKRISYAEQYRKAHGLSTKNIDTENTKHYGKSLPTRGKKRFNFYKRRLY